MCWTVGDARAPKSSPSRRSPTRPRRRTATVAGFPAAIRSCTPGRLPPPIDFRAGLTQFATTRPVHGECGGYMVLGESLEDADGVSHRMVGLLGHATSFAHRKLHLGYRQARLLADSPLGKSGTLMRGHEFHYAALTTLGQDEPLAELADSQGERLAQWAAGAATSPAPSSTPSPKPRDGELSVLLRHMRLCEGRHAGVAGERGAQDQHRDRPRRKQRFRRKNQRCPLMRERIDGTAFSPSRRTSDRRIFAVPAPLRPEVSGEGPPPRDPVFREEIRAALFLLQGVRTRKGCRDRRSGGSPRNAGRRSPRNCAPAHPIPRRGGRTTGRDPATRIPARRSAAGSPPRARRGGREIRVPFLQRSSSTRTARTLRRIAASENEGAVHCRGRRRGPSPERRRASL